MNGEGYHICDSCEKTSAFGHVVNDENWYCDDCIERMNYEKLNRDEDYRLIED